MAVGIPCTDHAAKVRTNFADKHQSLGHIVCPQTKATEFVSFFMLWTFMYTQLEENTKEWFSPIWSHEQLGYAESS
jgi:hypothetical protein